MNCLGNQFAAQTTENQIGDRARNSRHWQAMPLGNLFTSQFAGMETCSCKAARGGARNGEMNFCREMIGKIVQGQSTIMRNDRFFTGCQPGNEQVGKRHFGKVCQPIYTAADANEFPALSVVGKQGFRKSRLPRLPCREVTGLAFGDLV